MCCLHWLWIEWVIVTILAMEDGNFVKDYKLLLKDMFVVACTKLM